MKYYASIKTGLKVLGFMFAAVACSTTAGSRGEIGTEGEATEPGPAPGADDGDGTDSSAPPSTGDAGGVEPPRTCEKAPPANVCGVSPQCGCPSGETCDVIDGIGTAVCVPSGDTPMGRPCASTDECALGLTCIFGTCHAFCDRPGETCALPGTGLCEQVKTQQGSDVPNLAICRVACALHDPTSCGGQTASGVAACFADGKGGTDCQSGSTKGEGDACSGTEPCGPGFVCTTPAAGAKSSCKRWCRLGRASEDCGSGKSCNGFDPAVRVGDVVYGSCS